MNLNLVMLIGRITRDAESKVTPGGQNVVNFSIATNSVWMDKNNQKQESTEFHNLVLWGKRGEALAPYLTKGKLIMIDGELRTRSWTGQDSQKKYRTEIFVKNLQFGPRTGGDNGFVQNNDSPMAKEEKNPIEEDLPVIQAGSEDSPFEEDLEGDEIPF